MTDFKVTDEVVRAAMSIYYASFQHGTEVYYSEEVREAAMRAAIEALLPVMFQRIGFTNTEELNELIAGRGGWVSGLELDGDTVTLYRIKEPK